MVSSTSLSRLALVLAGSQCLVLAQTADFNIPSAWNYTDISNYSVSQRSALAKGLVDTTLLNINAPYNASDGIIDDLGPEGNANFMSAIALLDHINGTKTYQSMVVGGLNTVMRLNATTSFPGTTQDLIWYGLTAVDAYRAYGDPTSLQAAETLWNWANQYVIQPADAAQGKHPVKTVPIASTCSGATTAGGVLDSYDAARSTDPTLKGYTTSSFAGLSAYLYELTQNSTYLAAAEQTAQFVRAQLYNGAVIQDTMNMTDCTRVAATASFDSGFYIEALSVLAGANSTWTPFLDSLVSSVIPFSSWTGTDGINIEFAANPTDRWSQNSRSYLFRGLYSAWNRTDPTSDTAKFIEAYVNTQFYGLQNFASSSGSNLYNTLWHGPPPGSFFDFGQVDAAWVLNSALAFARANGSTAPGSTATSSTSSPTSSTTSTTTPSNNKAIIGAAVGGVVGGLFLILGVIAGIVFYRRRRARLQDEQRIREELEFKAVPFEQEAGHAAPYASPESAPASSSQLLPSKGGVLLSPRRFEEERSPSSVPSSYNPATDYGSENDVSAVPALLARLNNIMSGLPRGASEAPPQYDERG